MLRPHSTLNANIKKSLTVQAKEPVLLLPTDAQMRIGKYEEVKDQLYRNFRANGKHVITIFCPCHLGYGDLLFGLRAASLIDEEFLATKINFVSNKVGKKKIIDLKGNVEFKFDGALYDTEEYLSQSKGNKVDLMIEAPVFSLLKENFKNIYNNENLLLISEYAASDRSAGYSTTISASEIKAKYKVNPGINEKKMSVINTGLSPAESGIMIDTRLSAAVDKKSAWDAIPDLYKSLLLKNKTYKEYERDTEFAIGYSNQYFERGIAIFAEFAGYSAKNGEILVLGENSTAHFRKNELSAVTKKIIQENGFNYIIIHDAEYNLERYFSLHTNEFIDNLPTNAGKTFKIIYMSGMPHQVLINFKKIAGAYSYATGDQSITEEFSRLFSLFIGYESLFHKRKFINQIRELAKEFEKFAPGISRTIELLTWYLPSDKLNYEQVKELGILMKNENIRKYIKKMNTVIRKSFNLNERIVERVNRLLLYVEHPSLQEAEEKLLSAISQNAKNIEELTLQVVSILNEEPHQTNIHEAIKTYNWDLATELLKFYKTTPQQSSVNQLIDGKIALNMALNIAATAENDEDAESAEKIFMHLLELGADVTLKDDSGVMPLQLAVSLQAEEAMVNLIKKGAPVNCINENGETLLHLAAKENNEAICKILIAKKVDSNRKDNNGKLPFEYATDPALESFLKKHAGAKLEADRLRNKYLNKLQTITHSHLQKPTLFNSVKVGLPEHRGVKEEQALKTSEKIISTQRMTKI